MKIMLAIALLWFGLRASGADAYVICPTLPPGPVCGPTETGSIFPFLIMNTQLSPPVVTSMRYQQVCNGSLFTNVSSDLIYVTSLTISLDPCIQGTAGFTVPSMQINLSTTTKTADNLSMVFSENVGPDDTVVLDPTSYDFPSGYNVILFNRPFRFRPPLGNLLIDVRVYNGGTPSFPPHPLPQLDVFNTSTDEVSRVWATNVTATTASGSDTIGLLTVVELSPIPSLQAQFHPTYGGRTNIITIRWPSEPTNFVLQTSRHLGPQASWGPVTNQILGGPGPNANSSWGIDIPGASAGPESFYRLIWPSGTGGTNIPGCAVPSVGPSNQGTR